MLMQTATLSGILSAGALMMQTIPSRFGEITVDTSKSITFPRGLLGMPGDSNFVLANFPNPKMQQFTLLQSVDQPNLSFITLPIEPHNAIIGMGDINSVCNDLQIDQRNLALLLIVSVHRGLGEVKLSVNARAPLFIDAERRTGLQYVFQNEQYKVQHML